MTSSSCCKISPIIPIFVSYLLVLSSSICLVHSSDTGKNLNATNQTTLRPEEELHKLKFIRAHLNKINKPASPDGDIIDCVETHLQPAFDHPKLKGQRPLDPPARPNGHKPSGMITEEFQLWSFSGESCPEGTIPIRRTTEQDVLRATSVGKFGRKKIRRVSPELYGDNYPRFFTYWTDPKHGNWWLEFGSGVLVGYWPSFLFTHLTDHASMVQFGGEIVNSRPSGFHTSTQMGSGHFAGEGFGKASYFRNLQVVDWDNNLIPLSNLRVLADHPNCYDIQGGINRVWGNYFYYGGPGKNPRCP
ncbi:Carboxyl-terminal peptidase [Citrus sinensis]|nr:Carboxyl-terminal peptidase [Citrus sinensis]